MTLLGRLLLLLYLVLLLLLRILGFVAVPAHMVIILPLLSFLTLHWRSLAVGAVSTLLLRLVESKVLLLRHCHLHLHVLVEVLLILGRHELRREHSHHLLLVVALLHFHLLLHHLVVLILHPELGILRREHLLVEIAPRRRRIRHGWHPHWVLHVRIVELLRHLPVFPHVLRKLSHLFHLLPHNSHCLLPPHVHLVVGPHPWWVEVKRVRHGRDVTRLEVKGETRLLTRIHHWRHHLLLRRHVLMRQWLPYKVARKLTLATHLRRLISRVLNQDRLVLSLGVGLVHSLWLRHARVLRVEGCPIHVKGKHMRRLWHGERSWRLPLHWKGRVSLILLSRLVGNNLGRNHLVGHVGRLLWEDHDLLPLVHLLFLLSVLFFLILLLLLGSHLLLRRLLPARLHH